jgi:hypothetical protein
MMFVVRRGSRNVVFGLASLGLVAGAGSVGPSGCAAPGDEVDDVGTLQQAVKVDDKDKDKGTAKKVLKLAHWKKKWGKDTKPAAHGKGKNSRDLVWRSLLGPSGADNYMAVIPGPNETAPTVAKDVRLKVDNKKGTTKFKHDLSNVPLVGLNSDGDEPNVCGTPSFTEPKWGQGLSVTLKGEVKIPPKNDVDQFSATERVHFRPQLDLQATGPAKLVINAPMIVTVVVSEKLMDSGAEARVVMRGANGEILDQTSHPIWVAPGGSAQVSMTTVFKAPGQYKLTVGLEDQCPADYDPAQKFSRKTKELAIEVVLPREALQYSLTGWQSEWAYTYATQGNFSSAGNQSGAEFTEVGGGAGRQQTTEYWAWTATPVSYPIDQIHVKTSAGGKIIEERTLVNVPSTWGETWTDGTNQYESYGSATYFPDTNSWLYSHSFKNEWGTGSGVGHTTAATDVSYWSSKWTHYFGTFGCDGCVVDATVSLDQAEMGNIGHWVDLAPGVQEETTYTDGNVIYGGLATIQANVPFTDLYTYSYCWDDDWSWSRDSGTEPAWMDSKAGTAGLTCKSTTGGSHGYNQWGYWAVTQ